MAILHRSRPASVLMPRYVERFRCTGAACEDTCCASWPIHIDKKTYKAYRQTTAPQLSAMSARILVREAEPEGSAAYATIRLQGETQQCALMQDGLCGVHKHLNESYLSDVCFTYPRVSRTFNGQMEHALTLSCPEAARLALLAEDAFDFVEASVVVRETAVVHSAARQGLDAAAMSDVRIFCLNLMRTRELELWQRLAILGTFCAALSRLCAQGQQADIPRLIDDIAALVEQGGLVASLAAVQPNHAAQAMVFSVLWSAKGFDSPSPFQRDLIQKISTGLGADAAGQASGDRLAAAYGRGLARLETALHETPYLLEHYLLNEMFMRLFPFETQDVYDGYLRMIARFGLLRLLLAARCNGDDTPTPGDLASIVQLHCRRFQHDFTYTTLVNQALQDSGWADLDKLTTLVRT